MHRCQTELNKHREFYLKFGGDIYSEKSTSFVIYNELWHSDRCFSQLLSCRLESS